MTVFAAVFTGQGQTYEWPTTLYNFVPGTQNRFGFYQVETFYSKIAYTLKVVTCTHCFL